MIRKPDNYWIHQSVRSVTGLAEASPAPARAAGDPCVMRRIAEMEDTQWRAASALMR